MGLVLNIDEVVKEMQKDIEEFNKSVMIKEVQGLESNLKKIRDHCK